MKIKLSMKTAQPELAQDTSLPYTGLVSYNVQVGDHFQTKYDVVTANKQVDIFDYYYDKYGKNFLDMKQSEGRINPKLWNPPGSKSKVTTSKK